MCSVSSLYGDQAITDLLKSCKGWGKVLWEIQFEFKIQINIDHSNMILHISCRCCHQCNPRMEINKSIERPFKI